MKRSFYRISALILCISLANIFATAQINSKEDAEIADKVRIAFEQAKEYKFARLNELEKYGKKIIPYLEPYLTTSDLSIRYLTLGLLENAKEPEFIQVFSKAVQDSDPETSRRGSQYLYDNFDHQTLAQNAAVGEALRQGAAKGHHSISLIILLGYFPGDDTEKALLSIRDKDDLRGWSNKSEYSLSFEMLSNVPVYLSLNRIDNQKYSAPFSDLIKKASSGEIEFLLFTLNYIDDKTLLKQIFDKGIVNRKILDTEYGIEGGLMAKPMRVKDLTTNKFAAKLKTNLGFKLRERYTPAKINIARQKILAQLAAQ